MHEQDNSNNNNNNNNNNENNDQNTDQNNDPNSNQNNDKKQLIPEIIKSDSDVGVGEPTFDDMPPAVRL